MKFDDSHIHDLIGDTKEKGLKALHHKYADAIYWLGLRYMKNGQDAEEVVLDTFLKVFENLGAYSFDRERGYYAWLKKIAVNECLMRIRKQKLKIVWTEEVPEVLYQADILDHMDYEEVVHYLAKLPHLQSVVFQLYEIEGYNHVEIAEKLQVSVGTSKAYLHHAKHKLQNLIKQEQTINKNNRSNYNN